MKDIGDGRIYVDLRKTLEQIRECLDDLEKKVVALAEAKDKEGEGDGRNAND